MDDQAHSQNTSSIATSESTNSTPQKTSKKILLIILGILELPFPALALYMLFPLIRLQNTLESNNIGSYIGLIFFIFALIVALIQIVIGFLSFDMKLGEKKTKTLIIVGIVTAILTVPIIIMTIIMPVYSSVDAIK